MLAPRLSNMIPSADVGVDAPGALARVKNAPITLKIRSAKERPAACGTVNCGGEAGGFGWVTRHRTGVTRNGLETKRGIEIKTGLRLENMANLDAEAGDLRCRNSGCGG